METTLTARDKKLLYILGFIVIAFVFGWLLMRPVIRSISKTEENIASAEALRQQNETKVMGLMSAHTLAEKFEEDLAAATEEYYAPMDSSEIDKMFTMYVLGFGLQAKDLLINMPATPLEEVPYKYSEAGIELQKREGSSSSSSSMEETEASEKEGTTDGITMDADAMLLTFVKTPLEAYSEKQMLTKDTTASGIRAAEVTIVLTGTETGAQKLLDDILVKPSMRVTGFAWDEMPPVVRTLEDGTVMVSESREKQLTIRLKLYMYDSEKAGIEAPRKKD
ncbi:MAG: hypothetical protein K6B69_10780 [Lachnospiraceae bacterium]|nr:hypothetical protein [Lachnospiraceae bacterium]